MSDQPSTESQPVREKLLPRISIRFLMIAMVIAAIAMLIMRMSAESSAFWTKIIVLVMFTAIGCFAIYAVLFSLASVMTVSTEPIAKAIERKTDTPVDQGKEMHGESRS